MSTSSTTSRRLTRRAALASGAALGAAGVLAGSAEAAGGTAGTDARTRAAGRRPEAKQTRTGSAATQPRQGAAAAKGSRSLPDTRTRHILSRFTPGVTPAVLADVKNAGGIDAWFTQQLSPQHIPDPKADATFGWFPVLSMTPAQMWQNYLNGDPGWEMMQDFQNWTMLRRLLTKRTVLEAMTDFWANLVCVPPSADLAWVYRIDYEEMLRSHALGSYIDLLTAAVQHPCMGLYLNNVESTQTALNQNLGRELLECHTVGVNAPYTQDMVVDSARILTGYHVDVKRSWKPTYVPADHWVGRVTVLKYTSPNTHTNGQPVVLDYLRYLAKHPLTAQRVCQRLAVRFCNDFPSDALVQELAAVYLQNETQIVPVLEALIASDEFNAPATVLSKLRTPVEDALATWAVLNVTISPPKNPQSAANMFLKVSKAIGQGVYDWPPPNGFPDVAPAWSGAGRILGSFHVHWMASGGFFPKEGISYVQPADWLPQLPAAFQDCVEYVVNTVLQLPMTDTMLSAACAATGLSATATMQPDGPLVRFLFPRLMLSILDTPEHLSR